MAGALLKAFNANKTSWVGLVIFLIIALMAIFAPLVAGQDPLEQDILARLKPPSEAHLLGTDYFGRDIYSRIVYGARLSLIIGLTSTALAMVIGSAIGMIAVEFPSAYASDATDYLAKGMALRDAQRDEPLLTFCLAPHAPYTVSDATFERIAVYAAELDVPVHTHLHETQDEIRDSLKAHGLRPLARLKNLGLLGPNLIAVHAVHLAPEEIALLAEHGCHVAHCPTSNLKLASGLAPVQALLQAGVNVGIGTDSAASNNRLDMLSELRLAALLGKLGANDAAALPAQQALEMCDADVATGRRLHGWPHHVHLRRE